MQTIPSASKKLYFFILFLLQFFAKFWFNVTGRLWNTSKQSKHAKMLTSNASSSKLLGKNMLQSVGNFLEPDSEQKMKETSKQWGSVKIYENILPNESEVAVFRNVKTEEIIWESIKLKNFGTPMPNKEELASYLRRNDSAKWSDVYVWLAEYRIDVMKNKLFTKELMLVIAENVPVTITALYEVFSPLMIAAEIDDTDSILELIKRGADVNQRDLIAWTPLHYAALYSNINACATLLDNNANINAANKFGNTPLMYAAINKDKNLFEFLIEKGANETLTNNDGETASQLARFQQR